MKCWVAPNAPGLTHGGGLQTRVTVSGAVDLPLRTP